MGVWGEGVPAQRVRGCGSVRGSCEVRVGSTTCGTQRGAQAQPRGGVAHNPPPVIDPPLPLPRRRYGFVRFCNVGEAQAAITALDGTTVLGHTLQVKFADADAGPPSSAAPSGLTPSDSCYVKHLPASYGVQEVQQLFETHGAVLDVKLFPCLGARGWGGETWDGGRKRGQATSLHLRWAPSSEGSCSCLTLAPTPCRPVPRRQRARAHGVARGL